MTCFDLLGSFLLVLPMVYLVSFTRRAHSWLFQFIVELGSFSEMCLSRQSVPILHCHGDLFLHWCRALHLLLVIFRTFLLAHFFRLFRSPWGSILCSTVSAATPSLLSSTSSLRDQASSYKSWWMLLILLLNPMRHSEPVTLLTFWIHFASCFTIHFCPTPSPFCLSSENTA